MARAFVGAVAGRSLRLALGLVIWRLRRRVDSTDYMIM
jgi:hypothetical protein